MIQSNNERPFKEWRNKKILLIKEKINNRKIIFPSLHTKTIYFSFSITREDVATVTTPYRTKDPYFLYKKQFFKLNFVVT